MSKLHTPIKNFGLEGNVYVLKFTSELSLIKMNFPRHFSF